MHYEKKSGEMKIGLGATWFDQKYNDLIIWVFDPVTFGFSPSNLNKAKTSGLELSGEFTYGFIFMNANWTILNAKDSVTGDLLPRRAKESGSLTLGIDVGGFYAEAQTNIVGPRYSTTGNLKPMAGYHKSDLRISYAINETWTVKARMENIENKKYEEVSGYGVMGRASYLGVNATF
jgi:vitamin B12 transporter